jgi:POT family proton-dependent oligopeptide transporter
VVLHRPPRLKGIGAPEAGRQPDAHHLVLGCLCVIPVVYFLLAAGAKLQIVLTVLFIGWP